MKIFATSIIACFATVSALAQPAGIVGDAWKNPAVGQEGVAPYRTEFISYGARDLAEQGAKDKNEYYVEVSFDKASFPDRSEFNVAMDVPYMWLDREVFVRVFDIPAFYITVNGRQVGYAEDSRLPAEFNISGYLTDGDNVIRIVPVGDATGTKLEGNNGNTPSMYVFSQPKLRIEDYIVSARPDSLNKYGIFNVKIALANSYNLDEKITIGYDIYSPEGKLLEYSIRDITLKGQGRDTLEFSEFIYGTAERLWCAENPKMYYGILSVRRDGRMIEYVPYRVGFGTNEITGDGRILRNGKEVKLKPARYNAAADAETTKTQLAKLKKEGINTLLPDYPQPAWFYDICEDTGLYVIEQANINSTHSVGNRKLGGAYSNAPQWLGSHLSRAEAMYERNRNRTCIIGWSLGGKVGNGYNMYKCYQWLKAADADRAVIFRYAQGEWNTDIAITQID